MNKYANNSITQEHGPIQCYDFWLKRGNRCISAGNFVDAQCCYEEAAFLGADEPQLYIGLGAVALEKKQLEDAMVAFKVALRLDKNCAEAFCGLAIVHQQKHDFAEAYQMYIKCLELDNEHLRALIGLFQASCQIKSFSKIRQYLELYLKIHHNDTVVMFSLATLYMNDGRLNEAEKVLLDVLTLEPAFANAANLLEEIEHQLAQKKTKTL